MRVRTVLFAVLTGTTVAAAQPGASDEELPPPETAEAPPPEPEPAPLRPPPAPEPVVVTPVAPGSAVPPITINITNNNNGNNSNTNTQTNSQANPQTNSQTNAQENAQTTTQTATVPVTVTTSLAPPSGLASLPPAVDHYELLRAKQKPARWITLGVTSELHGPPAGIRGSIDLIGRGAWTLGVAGAISHDGDFGHGKMRGGDGHGKPTASAVGYIAWTGKLGRLDIRAQVGLGASAQVDKHDHDGDEADAVIKRTTTTDDDQNTDGGRRHPRLGMRAEAAVLVGLPLGKHLGLVAGPVLSAEKPEAGEDKKRAVDAQVMAGLRWRF